MKLCIAEKPSVAKELARILGANNRKDGYFEGNGYQVSWTFGHLCTLKEPEDYTPDWKSWRINYLPMIPHRFGIKLIDDTGIKKQFATIEKLVQDCDEVINCGDAGIEGEVIQRWVLTKAQCKKPLKRLWISSLTDEAIREGFENLKEGTDFDLLYAAGNARAIGDWLLGMNATRMFTIKYANNRGVLSIGRVQTPTLALIVNRHLEIERFVPEPYWEIKTTYRDVLFNSTKGRYIIKEEALEAIEKIKEAPFEVVSFEKKKGAEQPPRLFDLTSLQVECNKKYNFTADETLRHIQKLYERKMVSYPRVDTTFLPNDMFPKIPGILKKLTPYAQFTEVLLKDKIRKNKKVFDDKKITDHHAIVPTGEAPNGLMLAEKQVYDTITRRFISVFYPDCIVENTTVLGMVSDVEFKATGKVIVEPGWRVLYPKKDNESQEGDEEQLMPIFEKGEQGPHTPDILEKLTQPPKPYTEATLLRAMETAGKQVEDEELRDLMKENGIGRPSTRANIIETLFKRKYVVRVRKNLQPTITGVQLIATIKNELLKSVELTGMWEKKLRQIENGEFEAARFMDEMKTMVSELVMEVKRERGNSITIEKQEEEKESKAETSTEPKEKKEKDKTLPCPKCGEGTILKGKTAFGCSAYAKGCTFKVSFEAFGKKLTEKQLLTLIEKGKSPAIKGFAIEGNKVDGKLAFNENFDVIIEQAESKPDAKSKTDKTEPKEPETLTCPKCQQGQMLKGKSAYGCSRYKEGCHFVIPFDVLEKQHQTSELTNEILRQLV